MDNNKEVTVIAMTINGVVEGYGDAEDNYFYKKQATLNKDKAYINAIAEKLIETGFNHIAGNFDKDDLAELRSQIANEDYAACRKVDACHEATGLYVKVTVKQIPLI